jgi:phage terminase large subunit
VLDGFWPKKDWKRYWAVDFGFTNPFVLQCWAEDPDGRLYLYRELYRTKRLVEDHARDILRLVTKLVPRARDTGDDVLASVQDGRRVWKEPTPTVIVCDHDAEDRETLTRHLGMPTRAANKKVSEGIQAVASRFRRQEDGKPRLYISRTALVERDLLLVEAKKPCSTLEEIPGYVWDIANGKPAKESPRKEDDHGCDALRYICAERDLGKRFNLRWLE